MVGALQPLPSLLSLLAMACRMLSCLPAPPCWCWELGLLCCPVLARLADGHPWLPGSLHPQQLATQVAAEWGLPAHSTACQEDHQAGRHTCSVLPTWQALSIPGLACSLGLLTQHCGNLGVCSAPGIIRTSRCCPARCRAGKL